jgi:hypothetical protein
MNPPEVVSGLVGTHVEGFTLAADRRIRISITA